MSQLSTFAVSGGILPPFVATQYTTDAGIAVPVANNLNVFGGTAGRDINTSGAGATIHIDLKNAITLGDLVALGAGVPALTATTGDIDITAGNLNLPDTNAGGTAGRIIFGALTFIQDYPAASANFMAGFLVGNTTMTGGANNGIGGGVFSMLSSGAENSGFGHTALQTIKTGNRNSAYGEAALNGMDSGNNNTAIGYQAANLVSTGSNNIAVGQLAGSAWTLGNSNNIAVGNVGVIADSGFIRIGTNATHTKAFIAGIDGVNVGSTAKVVSMGTGGTADELGTTVITAGTGITITPGANTITISASGTTSLTYTNVNTTPYVVLTTDEYLSVDCSGGAITLQFPNAATSGRTYVVKDRTGSANSNPITITTVGGAVNIDGSTSYSMNTQYAAIQLMGNGSTYEIF